MAVASINIQKNKGGGGDPHCDLERECENADKAKKNQNCLLLDNGMRFYNPHIKQRKLNALQAEEEKLEREVAEVEQKLKQIEAVRVAQLKRELLALRERRILLVREEELEQAAQRKLELKAKEEKLKLEVARKESELKRANSDAHGLEQNLSRLSDDLSNVRYEICVKEYDATSIDGRPDDVTLQEQVQSYIKASGGKPRKDSVENVSIIVQASHEWYEPDEHGNFNPERVQQFCDAFVEFAQDWQKEGMTPVRAVLQMDERTPHIHATFVPFDLTGKLNCKYHLGGREKLAKVHDRFAEFMEPLGIDRGKDRYRDYLKRASFDDIAQHAERTQPVRRKEPREHYCEVNAGKQPLTIEDLAMANRWKQGKLNSGMTIYYDRADIYTGDVTPNNPLYIINKETEEVFRARHNEQNQIIYSPDRPLCNLNDAHALARDYYNRSGVQHSDAEIIPLFAHHMRLATGAQPTDSTMLARAQQSYDSHVEVQARLTQQATRQEAIMEHQTHYAPDAPASNTPSPSMER